MSTGEILPGLWRFEARHPEWSEDEGGEDGWEPVVGWWALAGDAGLVLVDPLVEAWEELDRLVAAHGCAGIVRTCHWHERSIPAAAARYGAEVWAKPGQGGAVQHAVADGESLFGQLTVHDVERADEIALWAPAQAAIIFGDAMIRRADGTLRMCPESWTMPPGGPERLRELLRALAAHPVEHVLVAHGPLVLGDGGPALAAALGR